MNTKLTKAVFAIATICLLASSASAQNQFQAMQQAQPAVAQQRYVQPPQTNQYYFGVNVELIRSNWGGSRLRIVSVTHGSPAFRAGLEAGDEIVTLNGRSFDNAYDSFDAVRLMNRFVSIGNGPGPFAGGGGGAPAAAAAYIGLPAPPQRVARMIVRNVRNGQNVSINVYPTLRGGYGGPAPAAAASVR